MPDAVLLDIGGLQLVAPRLERLGRATMDSVGAALFFDALGFGELAQTQLRRAEKRFQITDRQRRIARGEAEPEALIADAQAERLRQAAAEHDRAVSLIPRDEPELTAMDLRNIARAEALIEEAKTLRDQKKWHAYRKAHEKVVEARGILVELERSLTARMNQRWADRVLQEVISLEVDLAEGHAEFVVATGRERTDDGSWRLVLGRPLQCYSRDGVLTLVHSGALNRPQAQALLTYRALYEKTDPERALRPIVLDPADQRVPHGGDGWALKLAEFWNDREAIEAKVRSAHPTRGVGVLQKVGGQGKCLWQFSKGAAHALNRDALVVAANVLTDHYGMA